MDKKRKNLSASNNIKNSEPANFGTGLGSGLDITAAELIWSYLTFHGFRSSAAAYISEWQGTTNIPINSNKASTTPLANEAETCQSGIANHLYSLEWKSIEYRQRNISIRHNREIFYVCLDYLELYKLICDGQILEALEYAHQFFPTTIDLGSEMDTDRNNGPDATSVQLASPSTILHFQMLCQHFVELIRKACPNEALEFVEVRLAPLATLYPNLAPNLQEVIVLLAYSDPMASPISHLLALEAREKLALKANSFILQREESALETIVRQTIAVNDLLKGFDPMPSSTLASPTTSDAGKRESSHLSNSTGPTISSVLSPFRINRFDFAEFVDLVNF